MRVIILGLLALTLSFGAHAEKRIALVIGNSDYEGTARPLNNPVKDADLIASKLEAVGFEVFTLKNATRPQMVSAFKAHGDRLKRAGKDAVGFLYFAGHGIQSEGLNYLAPVEMVAYEEADVWGTAPRLGDAIRHMKRAGNTTNFIVLDACRNNPLPSSTRDLSGGLAQLKRNRGVLIAYATQPGAVAEDGSGYKNSPFTDELARLITQKGLPAESLFRRVATAVNIRTDERQLPWYESGLLGSEDFCFAGCRQLSNDEATALGNAIASGDLARLKSFRDRFPGSASRGLIDREIAQLETATGEAAGSTMVVPAKPVAKLSGNLAGATEVLQVSHDGNGCTDDPETDWNDCLLFSAAYSADGARFVTASKDRTASVWDANTGRLISRLEGHEGNVYSAAFSPDGKHVVTASNDKTAQIWDAETGRHTTTLTSHAYSVNTAVFSPDGDHIVTASDDNTAKIWNAGSGQLITTLTGHDGDVASAAFSPDGQQIVTASWDDTAKVWNAATGDLIATLTGHGYNVNSAAFSPDGTRIVTASFDKTAKIWDAATGRLITTLTGHKRYIQTAAYSPDAKHIITSSRDGTAKIWNAATASLITTLKGHTDTVTAAAFNPNGTHILTASYDATARVWQLDFE